MTYRVSTHVSAPAIGKQRDVIRGVMVRTSDDIAVVQDLPQGANQLAHGFPVTPNFDALSNFVLSWKVGFHSEVSSYVQPLTYSDAHSSADVVVVRLRQYHAEYAADSSEDPSGKTHVTLEPYDFVKRQVIRPDSTFFLSDVYIDNSTGLPTEVRYAGGDDITFIVDYTILEGHWLINHAHYEETLHGPLRIGSLHVIADAVYDQFAFPPNAPDPRLVAAPAPTVTPSAGPS